VPLNSAQLFIRDTLDGTSPPGDTGLSGPLVALITPYDPDQSGAPRAYVWPSMGREKRRAKPRNHGPGTPAAVKDLNHTVEVFLVWFDSDSDPDADINFPGLIDYVMDLLRTCDNPALVTDPLTGRVSQLVDIGEDMTYTYVPPRSTADQRILRYDARISVPFLETFQA
jgi:hypothetical protein